MPSPITLIFIFKATLLSFKVSQIEFPNIKSLLLITIAAVFLAPHFFFQIVFSSKAEGKAPFSPSNLQRSKFMKSNSKVIDSSYFNNILYLIFNFLENVLFKK